MKLTKIVATIGPTSEDEEQIRQLLQEGVNVIRFNFKHNTIDWHRSLIQKVRGVANTLNLSVGSLLDLQGPEVRIKILKGDQLEIVENIPVYIDEDISISHPSIFEYLQDGQHVVANDGQFIFSFKKEGNKSVLVPQNGGVLKNNKSMNIPGADFPLPVLTPRDIDGIKMAAEVGIDFIALSFVRLASDINALRQALEEHGCHAKIISKIETKKAIENIDEIIQTTDAVMVARGDLGVELPIEQVPHFQKMIIRKCIETGKPVITATQMLESMIEYPFPTRAEISDIANAAYDLTDAVMLSGETAYGKYPLEAVRVMAKTVTFNEDISLIDTRTSHAFDIQKQEAAICDAAYNLYRAEERLYDIAAFIVLSKTGNTARMLSRYRPQIPIYAIVPTSDIAESLTINFAVYPQVTEESDSNNKEVTSGYILATLERLKNSHLLKKDARVVVVHGDFWGVVGGASIIRVMTV